MRLVALANAGVGISGGFLTRAFTSPITLGIAVGYVVGRPVGITGTAWLVKRLSGGKLRPPVGWAAVALIGAVRAAVLALAGGDHGSALWTRFAARASDAIAYRFESPLFAYRRPGVDIPRADPAERLLEVPDEHQPTQRHRPGPHPPQ